MRKIIGIFLLLALMWEPVVSVDPAAGAKHLSEIIQYLLDFVKTSECIFIRNNKEHTAAEAAAHMQRKYEHFNDKIKTPEDFIRLAATKSLMTGQLYYVRLKDGKKLTSEIWLLRALDAYQHKQK
jgi:hypothetical protein